MPLWRAFYTGGHIESNIIHTPLGEQYNITTLKSFLLTWVRERNASHTPLTHPKTAAAWFCWIHSKTSVLRKGAFYTWSWESLERPFPELWTKKLPLWNLFRQDHSLLNNMSKFSFSSAIHPAVTVILITNFWGCLRKKK